jgi:hypothetical protein
LFSKCRIECRFPGSAYRGSHTCGSWMHLLLMILYVGLTSYCVFSLRYVLSHSWCNLDVSYEFLWTATLSDPPSSSPVCIVNSASPQCCCPDPLSATSKPSQLLSSL